MKEDGIFASLDVTAIGPDKRDYEYMSQNNQNARWIPGGNVIARLFMGTGPDGTEAGKPDHIIIGVTDAGNSRMIVTSGISEKDAEKWEVTVFKMNGTGYERDDFYDDTDEFRAIAENMMGTNPNATPPKAKVYRSNRNKTEYISANGRDIVSRYMNWLKERAVAKEAEDRFKGMADEKGRLEFLIFFATHENKWYPFRANPLGLIN